MNIKKITRVMSLIVLDIVCMNLAFYLAVYAHHEGSIPENFYWLFFQLVIVITPNKLLIYKLFSLYSSLWRYASIDELVKVVLAVIVGNCISIAYMVFLGMSIYPLVYIEAAVFEMMMVGGARFMYRLIRRNGRRRSLKNVGSKRVLIIGSGATATMVGAEIKNHPDAYGELIGYIDDDKDKHGRKLAGIKIIGNRYDILSISKRYKIDEIILAIPTLSKEDTKFIIEECKRTGAKVRIIPGIMEIMDGKVSMNKIRDVEIEDLLGRDPVDLNLGEIARYLEGKTVMVTGGGGSIGSELCRQIARFNPAKLIILDIYENNAYEIQIELLRTYGSKLNLEVLIASVRERDNIFRIIGQKKPDVIFHAAAHKHVPLMEHSPKEAIKNNVYGTMNVAEAAHEHGVERFVLISTDKAVNPTNVMGASKRMCEMIIQGLSKTSETKFVAVRFGNVLGSNGSVIPLFKKQILDGGPVTITHKDIIRFFMTIPEAAQLVIQAGAIANGGEIFVLDMGEPVKIYNLAEDLIKLSGLEPHKDIKIEVTGLRPGEKLYEELLMSEEGLINTKYKKIFIGSPGDITYPIFKKTLLQIFKNLETEKNEEVKNLIAKIVPTYKKDKTSHNSSDSANIEEIIVDDDEMEIAMAEKRGSNLRILRN